MINLFKRRVIAFILDFFVVSSIMWIISYILYLVANPYNIFTIYNFFPYIVPILSLAYFTICEKTKGATVGKALMHLKVVTYEGYQLSWIKSLTRSLSKICYFPILFDLLIGIVLGKDRFLNLLTHTLVVDEIQIR